MGTGLTPLGEQQVNFLINSTDGLTGAQAIGGDGIVQRRFRRRL